MPCEFGDALWAWQCPVGLAMPCGFDNASLVMTCEFGEARSKSAHPVMRDFEWSVPVTQLCTRHKSMWAESCIVVVSLSHHYHHQQQMAT